MILVRHVPTGIEVDLVCAGLPFEEQVITRAVQLDVAGVLMPLPTPEDLIVMRAVAGRPRDRLDVESVRRNAGAEARAVFRLTPAGGPVQTTGEQLNAWVSTGSRCDSGTVPPL